VKRVRATTLGRQHILKMTASKHHRDIQGIRKSHAMVYEVQQLVKGCMQANRLEAFSFHGVFSACDSLRVLQVQIACISKALQIISKAVGERSQFSRWQSVKGLSFCKDELVVALCAICSCGNIG
jgi:hypothetical protein